MACSLSEEMTVKRTTDGLLEEPTGETGTGYLRSVARHTATVLGTRWCFIGQVDPGEPTRVDVLAFWDGEFQEPFSYDLSGTPCEKVLEQVFCHYPRGVQAKFPEDQMLVEMGVEAYTGVAIADRRGIIGLVAALHDHPIESAEKVGPSLWVAASRAALELERMRSEAALRASDARYRKFVEQCIEGVWSIDAMGVTDFVNPQMAKMLGLRVEDMLGRSMYDFMDEAARLEAEQNMERRRRGIVERHSFRLKHADGRDVWTEMATNPIVDDAGETLGALALVTDVTERRQLLESMQQKQKLESLGLLAGGVAHDFNNLLVGILGNADVALLQPDLTPASEQLLTRIRTAGVQAAKLTKQLLAYAGHSPFRAEPIVVSKLVGDVAEMLRAGLTAQVSLALDDAVPLPPIAADRTQLTQVLVNLVTNAGDALGADGGEVRISTGLLEADDPLLSRGYIADDAEPVPHVFIRVSDDGVGMDEAARAHLFDPFFTTKPSGHGLGLAAVLGILRRHRGTVVIDSAPGEGSTFTVCLPVHADVVMGTEGSSGMARGTPTLAGRRVLLVDDEEMVRTVAREALGREGVQLDEAENGERALTMVEEASAPYDVILMDVAMPGIDGTETLRRLRARGCDTPVILCSGHASFAVREAPGTLWLPKPFQLSGLRDAVEVAISQVQSR